MCKRRRRRRKPLIFPLQKAGGSRLCVLDRDLELTSLVFEHLQSKELAYDTKGLQTNVVGLELVFLKPDFRVSALHLSFGGGGQMRHRAMGKGGLYISRSPLHHCALARWAPPACTACLCGRKGGGRQGRLLICVRAVPPPPPFHRREGEEEEEEEVRMCNAPPCTMAPSRPGGIENVWVLIWKVRS